VNSCRVLVQKPFDRYWVGPLLSQPYEESHLSADFVLPYIHALKAQIFQPCHSSAVFFIDAVLAALTVST
jgi:hypothetical protein